MPAMSDNQADNRIKNRKVVRCPKTLHWSVPMLVEECSECHVFFMYCCPCAQSKGPNERICHHYPIVFTDGACTNNGRPNAKSGVGIAFGNDSDCELSLPISDSLDNYPVRSNQRAELCATIMGLEVLASWATDNGPKSKSADKLIVTTDSEYVVKGITEWLPTWKKNNWRTAKGKTPMNLDLFVKLDNLIVKYETKGVLVGLWHIPREDNEIADSLAKAAAVDGDVASTLTQELGSLSLG